MLRIDRDITQFTDGQLAAALVLTPAALKSPTFREDHKLLERRLEMMKLEAWTREEAARLRDGATDATVLIVTDPR